MWESAHDLAMDSFINCAQTLLVAYIDPINGLVLEHAIPANHCEQMTYFIVAHKVEPPITGTDFLKSVQYGTVKAKHIESLLRMMTGIYAPIFFENTSWPDSILSANLRTEILLIFF